MAWPELFAAAAQGDLEGVRAARTPLHVRSPDGTTVLHAAATHAGDGLLRDLLRDSGLAVDTRDGAGRSPLHRGSERGCPEVIEVLVALGADPNAKDDAGKTPLDLSVDADEPLTIDALLEAGAKECAPDTMLRAAERGSVPALKKVAAQNPQAKTGDGRTLLHLTAVTSGAELVETLVKAGVSIEAKDTQGWTALHFAAAQGQAPLVKALLAAGADVNARDNERRTPLHRIGPPATQAHVDALLAAGADLDAKDNAGFTPLELALEFELHPACDLLGPHFTSPPGALEEPGWGLVHYAAALGSKSAVDALREARRLAEPSEDGFTVLHQAAAFGCLEAVDLLLQAGAPVDATSPDGHPPLAFAANEEVKLRLKGWGA
jgi:ankyrin repeat protein